MGCAAMCCTESRQSNSAGKRLLRGLKNVALAQPGNADALNSEPKTLNSKPLTPNTDPQTPDPKTQNPKPKTQNPNPKPKTQNSTTPCTMARSKEKLQLRPTLSVDPADSARTVRP